MAKFGERRNTHMHIHYRVTEIIPFVLETQLHHIHSQSSTPYIVTTEAVSKLTIILSIF